MEYRFNIKANGLSYIHILLCNGEPFQKIVHEGVIVLDIYKAHNHRYELAGFIYKEHRIIYPRVYGTKKELYGAIQKLLQELL